MGRRAMHGSRFGIITIVLSVVMALIAVCPCPASPASSENGKSHECCAGKTGFVSGAAVACCADDALATVAVTAAAPATVDVSLVPGMTLPAVEAPRPACPSFPLHAAPPVLRI